MARNAWERLPPGPERLFFEKINDLWWSRGAPPGRTLAAIANRGAHGISQGTINNLINGPRVPRWDNVARVVSVLKGDQGAFLALWRDAKRSQDGVTAPPSFVSGEQSDLAAGTWQPLDHAALAFEIKHLMRDPLRTNIMPLPLLSRVAKTVFPGDGHDSALLIRRLVVKAADQLPTELQTIVGIMFMVPSQGRVYARLRDRYLAVGEQLYVSERTARRRTERMRVLIAGEIDRLYQGTPQASG